jgi:tetratricopeptide (TPR) repeat protein
MLHHLGKLPEAEASLRECIPVQEHEQLKALAQSTLGAVLMDQQRYPDAIAVVEDSIRAWPDRGSSHRSIAEIWLMQNRELTTALEEARHALEIDRAARGLPQEALDSRVGEDLATLAWAEAANGASLAIVEALLSKAEPLCVRQAKAIQAQFHYHAGRAYQLSVGRRVQNTLRELRKSIHTGNTGALPKR